MVDIKSYFGCCFECYINDLSFSFIMIFLFLFSVLLIDNMYKIQEDTTSQDQSITPVLRASFSAASSVSPLSPKIVYLSFRIV